MIYLGAGVHLGGVGRDIRPSLLNRRPPPPLEIMYTYIKQCSSIATLYLVQPYNKPYKD